MRAIQRSGLILRRRSPRCAQNLSSHRRCLVEICHRYTLLTGDEHVLRQTILNIPVYVASVLDEFEQHMRPLMRLPLLLLRDSAEKDEFTKRLDTLRRYVRSWASDWVAAEL